MGIMFPESISLGFFYALRLDREDPLLLNIDEREDGFLTVAVGADLIKIEPTAGAQSQVKL
jgi:hypothetical protein